MFQVRDLVVFRGATPVVGPLTLGVSEGEIRVLVGRNGSGKSTFLSGLAGVLPCRGSITLGTEELSQWDTKHRLKAGIAFCPSGRHLFGELAVRENVLLGAYAAGRKEAKHRLQELQQITHFKLLADRSGQSAGTLSGGQQQIVALARALMSRPRLLLLDEPTAGLAPEAREEVGQIVRDFASREGHSVIIAEENLEFSCSIAHRFSAFHSGRLIFESKHHEHLDPIAIQNILLEGEMDSVPRPGEKNDS